MATDRPGRVQRLSTTVFARRASHLSASAFPIGLRSAMHVTLSSGEFSGPGEPPVLHLNWPVRGSAALCAAGGELPFGPGEAAIHLPGEPCRIRVLSDRAEMCWITIDGPLVTALATQLGLRTGVSRTGVAPTSRVARLGMLLGDPTEAGQRLASLRAIEMLYAIAAGPPGPEKPGRVARAEELIRREYADPELSVSGVAEAVGMHRGALSRLFRRATGVTVQDYLAAVRLEEARRRLTRTDESVAAIARGCGFTYTGYFCRWFRKQTGRTPSEVRARESLW